MIAFILDSYRKWSFPKGHVEKGESVAAAALREIREEMGLSRAWIVAPLGEIVIKFKDRFDQPGTMVHKKISYFLVETPADEKGKAENKKTGERVRAISWVPYRNAFRRASYKNTHQIIRKAIALLEEKV